MVCCYILIYVDDIIILGNSDNAISQLICDLNSKISFKDLGPLSYFLGIEVSYLPTGGLFLSQSKYIAGLLTCTKMVEARAISTPIVSGHVLSAHQDDTLNDPFMYRSVVGALQYATLMHPEISYSVNKACQFMHRPTLTHWQLQLVKRILRYLRGVCSHGLLFSCPSELPLSGFAHANWASDPDDRKSTSGFCIYFGGNVISWGSKKQSIISRSNTEVEYCSLAYFWDSRCCEKCYGSAIS